MPVFNFDQSAFPLLTPEQTSPLGGLLSDAIAKRLTMAKMEKAEEEAPYAGLAQLSQIMSRNAYAGAVTPQFQAKLMEHPELLANIKDPQKRLDMLLAFGNTSNANTSLNQAINDKLLKIANRQNNGGGNPLNALGKSILNLFGSNNNNADSANQQMMPQSNAMQYENTAIPDNIDNNPPRTDMGSQSGRTPENVAFGRRAGELKGDIEKGQEIGKKSGEQQAEYGSNAEGAISQQQSIKNLKNIFQKPVLERIANVPFVNQKALGWYKNSGTKEEKEAIGEMDAAMNSYIASSFSSFGGRLTNNDLKFLQSMKPNDGDLMDVRRGKLVALQTFNESKLLQLKLAHDYMKSGMDKTEAEYAASKAVDMNDMQQQAYNEIFPPPVKIKTRSGKIIQLPKRGAEQLLKDHPDYEVVE